MNPNALRSAMLPLIFILAVTTSVGLFVMVTSKGLVLAIAFGMFITAIIYSLVSQGAAIWCLIFAAYFEALYKGAVPSMFSMLIKDFFLMIAVLRLLYISQRQKDYRWLQQPFTTAAVVFVIYCVALMFAPSTRSILLALAGLRTWILWMPIYFPAYAYFTSRETVTKFLVALMLIQLPVQVYGIVQGNIGYEHTKVIPGFYEITKWYRVDVDVNEGQRPEGEGSSDQLDEGFKPIMSVRACSITISPGTFGSMANLTLLLALGVLSFTVSPTIRLWSLLTALAAAGGLLASGSRAPMVTLVPGLLVMVLLSRQKWAVIAGVLVVGLGAVFVLKDISGGGAIRLAKTLTFSGAIERAMYPLRVGWESGMDHPFGNGIATGAGMGRVFYSARLKTAEGARFIENEFGRGMSELGVVGTSIWLGMLLSLLWRCFRGVRSLGQTPEGGLAAGLFAVMFAVFVQLGVGAALYAAQPGIYFWLFGAAIMRLAQFGKSEPLQAVAPPSTGRRMRKFGRVWVPVEDYPQREAKTAFAPRSE